MTFKRTRYGIANQYLFHGVDFVVYVEGGTNSFTIEDIKRNRYNNDSNDIIFWERIFKKYNAKASLKFKAVGSKTTAIKIAEEIVDNKISSAYVAMDKEFDELLGIKIKSKQILYTYGYSWENDALSKELLKYMIEFLTANSVNESYINEPYNKFIKNIKIFVYADGYLFTKSDSFIPRNGYMKYIDCSIKKEPKLKKDDIKTLLVQKKLNKSTLYNFGSRNFINSERYCYGHLLFDFCWHLISYILKTIFNLKPVDKSIINRIILKNFIDFFDTEKDNYYKQLFL